MVYSPFKTKKGLRFLVIGRLQNRCGDVFFFVCEPVKYVIHAYADIGNQTKFSIHKVLRLRQASQIGQMPVIPVWKSRLIHTTAEFQSIQLV